MKKVSFSLGLPYVQPAPRGYFRVIRSSDSFKLCFRILRVGSVIFSREVADLRQLASLQINIPFPEIPHNLQFQILVWAPIDPHVLWLVFRFKAPFHFVLLKGSYYLKFNWWRLPTAFDELSAKVLSSTFRVKRMYRNRRVYALGLTDRDGSYG